MITITRRNGVIMTKQMVIVRIVGENAKMTKHAKLSNAAQHTAAGGQLELVTLRPKILLRILSM